MAVKKIRINEAEEVINFSGLDKQDVDKLNELIFENLDTVKEYLDIYNKFANQLCDYGERFSNVSLDINIISDFKPLNELITDYELRVYGHINVEHPRRKQMDNMFRQKFLITDNIHDIEEKVEQFDFSFIVNTYKLIGKFKSRIYDFFRIIKSMYVDVERVFCDFCDYTYNSDDLNSQALRTEYRANHNYLSGVDDVNDVISECKSLSSEIDNALNQLGV